MFNIHKWLFVLVVLLYWWRTDVDGKLNDEINNRFGEFSEKLFYQAIAESEDKANVFLSPWSIYSALSLALAATGGKTHEELLRALSLTSLNRESSEVHHLLGEWQRTSQSNDSYATLLLANRIFTKESFQLKTKFVDLLTTEYSASVGQVPFRRNPNQARMTINKWVEEKTLGKITDMLKKDDVDSFTKLVFTNAVYFNGRWRTMFNKTNTKMDSFHCLNSSSHSTVSMMEVKSGFYHSNDEQLAAQLLWLPFNNNKTQLVIILPNEANGLAYVESQLRNNTISKVSLLRNRNARNREVKVRVPRLNLESQVSLKSILSTSFGLRDFFTFGAADFSPMADLKQPLAASDVIHKAVFEMNEEGASAAASSAISIKWRMRVPPPIEFTVDRPFLFVIVHDAEIPLFMGRVICA